LSDYRLAQILHPDRKYPASSQENFAALSRAWNVLSKPHTRAAYLQTGKGWADTHNWGSREEPDWAMRQEILARSRHQRAAHSEAGSGAWGGYDSGKWRPTQEAGFNMDFSAEPTYMSNPKFLSTLALIVSGH
jgi:curved DNA-binding protein CbpA